MQLPDPSPWVAQHASLIPPGPVLDLAAGSGRHARLLSGLGYPVTALDRDVSRLADLQASPSVEVVGVEVVAADLEDGSPWPLGDRRFAGIVVTNYLHRPFLPRIVAALGPGGILIYATFGVGNERFGKPRHPDHLLRPGELLERAAAADLTVLAYFCGEVARPERAAVQQIVARAPMKRA